MSDQSAAVRRLLGPAGQEVTCDECFDRIDAFVELELSGADAEAAIPGMTAHLEGCPACREDHESLVALLESSQRERPARPDETESGGNPFP